MATPWAGTDQAILGRGNLDEIRERIRAIFDNRGVDYSQHLDGSTVDGEARLDDIAQRVISGQVALDSVRASVDRIASEFPSGASSPTYSQPRPPGGRRGHRGNLDDRQRDGGQGPGFPSGEGPERDVPQRRDLFAEAKAMFPFLPDDLLRVYVQGWKETDDHQQAVSRMREHPVYEQYFPGNRNSQGLLAMSEADYMAYSEAARKMMRQAGLPEGFYDEAEDIGRFIQNNLSLNEIRARVEDGVMAAQQAPREVRDELARFYGVNDGDLAAFFLDPEKGQKTIMRKFTAAQVGAASQMTGYGNLTASEAERLVGVGVDPNRARQGFSELAGMSQVFEQLVGHRTGGVSRDDQLAGTFEGDANSRNRMRRAQENRVATFGGGGGAASGEQIVGLKSSKK